jgi:hypothetical protein
VHFLKVCLGLSEESEEKAASVAEPAEKGALSHTGFLRDRLHGDVLNAVITDQATGRFQQPGAVASGIGTLGDSRGGFLGAHQPSSLTRTYTFPSSIRTG